MKITGQPEITSMLLHRTFRAVRLAPAACVMVTSTLLVPGPTASAQQPDTVGSTPARAAQTPEVAAPGSSDWPENLTGLRARVTLKVTTTMETHPVVDGIVLGENPDSLMIECIDPSRCTAGTRLRAFAWTDLNSLEVRRMRPASLWGTLKHAAWGIAGGALMGGALGAVAVLAWTTDADDADNGQSGPSWRTVPAGAAIGAGLGSVALGTAAVIWSRGVWVKIPLAALTERP